MTRFGKTSVCTAIALGGLLLVTSCDYSGGSDNSFNTRNGASISNISGFYEGLFSGGRAVESTTSGNINHLNIQQDGNRVRVTDSQGSTYIGNVGSPLDLIAPGSTTISDGALLATFQVSWSGKDEISQREIDFTGTINLVSVTDIQGSVSDNTRTSTTSSSSSSTTSSSSSTTTTFIEDNSIPPKVGPGGTEPGITNITEIITTEGGSNDGSSGGSNDGSSTVGDTVTYQLTEQNTQFRLRGTWVEQGGKVSPVDAIASGVYSALPVLLGEGVN